MSIIFFARVVRQEERKNGINILFMAPSAMDTEMYHENAVEKKRKSSFFLNLDKATVTAMKKAERGVGVYSPRFDTKAVRVLGKLVPSALIVKFISVEKSVSKE